MPSWDTPWNATFLRRKGEPGRITLVEITDVIAEVLKKHGVCIRVTCKCKDNRKFVHTFIGRHPDEARNTPRRKQLMKEQLAVYGIELNDTNWGLMMSPDIEERLSVLPKTEGLTLYAHYAVALLGPKGRERIYRNIKWVRDGKGMRKGIRRIIQPTPEDLKMFE